MEVRKLNNLLQLMKSEIWNFFLFHSIQLRKKIYFFLVFLVSLTTLKYFLSPSPITSSPKLPFVNVISSHATDLKTSVYTTAVLKSKDYALIKSEINGKVIDLPIPKGSYVKEGDILIRISDYDRTARFEEAKARLAHKQAEYQSALKLKEKDFTARNTLLSVQSELESAKANLKRVTFELENASPKAPFSGFYQTSFVEVGDTVSINDKLAVIINSHNIKAIADLSGDELAQIDPEGKIIVDSGSKQYSGNLTYQSKAADAKLHTYRVEVTFENPNQELKEGDFVHLKLPCSHKKSHLLPTSSLVLDDQGNIGIMCIDDQNIAIFVPVSIAQASQKGILVHNLSNHIRVIKNGGQFIKNGQQVKVDPQ